MDPVAATLHLIICALLFINGLYWRRKYRNLLNEVADPDDWPARDQRRLYGKEPRP